MPPPASSSSQPPDAEAPGGEGTGGPDEELMDELGGSGSAAAFSTLAGRWQPRIRQLAERLLGDAHRAEDIAQETFVRLHLHRRTWIPGRSFGVWIRRIAVNLCRDHFRRTARRPEEALEDSPAHQWPDAAIPRPDAAAADSDDAALVREAVGQLPETLRETLVLRHYEDLKGREIAEVLGVPEGTVHWRLAEALTRLRALLSPMLTESAASHPAARGKEQTTSAAAAPLLPVLPPQQPAAS